MRVRDSRSDSESECQQIRQRTASFEAALEFRLRLRLLIPWLGLSAVGVGLEADLFIIGAHSDLRMCLLPVHWLLPLSDSVYHTRFVIVILDSMSM